MKERPRRKARNGRSRLSIHVDLTSTPGLVEDLKKIAARKGLKVGTDVRRLLVEYRDKEINQ